MNKPFDRVLIFGTEFGVQQSLPFFSKNIIAGIVAPGNRPDQIKGIESLAQKNNVKMFVQPAKSSDDFKSFLIELSLLKPDFIWSNSYSMIIPKELLELVNYNAINIHWSLLPKNQGPNPIQWAIIKGEKKTGVTFHMMDDGLDSGDIIFQEELDIDMNDTWPVVFKKLEDLSAKMHSDHLEKILTNNFKRFKQDLNTATKNKRIDEDFPVIDFKKQTNADIYNLIRAQVAPLNGAFIKRKQGDNLYFKNKISMSEIENLRHQYEC
jgi:methionyl-tRNA formyltransferase